jgi:hypothetical protein
MIEPDVMMSSEETAALGQLKEIISANVPSGMIEAHAFRLVGEPQETIDAETGELKESIGHVSGREGGEAVGYVGTNDPVAKYHELGTRTIPPRSFLGEAAMRKEHKIHEMMERTVAATFDRGGPHYRELREL